MQFTSPLGARVATRLLWRSPRRAVSRVSRGIVATWAQVEMQLRRRLATNVRALRAERHLTLEAAAHQASMHWRHWQKIEAGEASITLRTLAKLAVALEREPTELLR